MAELSTTEAARRLGVSSSTVAEWCRTGKLSAYKVSGKWRIPEEELTRIEAQLRRQASLAPMVAILGGRRGLYRMRCCICNSCGEPPGDTRRAEGALPHGLAPGRRKRTCAGTKCFPPAGSPQGSMAGNRAYPETLFTITPWPS